MKFVPFVVFVLGHGWILLLFPKVVSLIIFLRERPYIFPEIIDGNALQPTLQLLRSQKKHQERIESLFHEIILKQRKKRILSIGRIQSIDGNIIHITAVIEDNIRTIEEFMKNGTMADEDTKREPLNDISSWMILHLLRSIKQWSNELCDGNWDREVQAMQEPLDLAIREMEAYRNYLAVVSDDAMKLATATHEPFSTRSGWRRKKDSEACDDY